MGSYINPQDLVGLSPEQIMQISDVYSRNTDFGAGVQQFLDERRRAMEQEAYERQATAEAMGYARDKDAWTRQFKERQLADDKLKAQATRQNLQSMIAHRNLLRDQYNREVASGKFDTYDIEDPITGEVYKGSAADAIRQMNTRIERQQKAYDNYLRSTGGSQSSGPLKQWEVEAGPKSSKLFYNHFTREEGDGNKKKRVPSVTMDKINSFNTQARKSGFEAVPVPITKWGDEWYWPPSEGNSIIVPVFRTIGGQVRASSIYDALTSIYGMSDEDARLTIKKNLEELKRIR